MTPTDVPHDLNLIPSAPLDFAAHTISSWAAASLSAGSSISLLAQSSSQPVKPHSKLLVFLWDPVVLVMLFVALVMLLALLAIRLGYYAHMEKSSRTVVKRLSNMIAEAKSVTEPPPAVVELKSKTVPRPDMGTATARSRPRPLGPDESTAKSPGTQPPSGFDSREIKELEKTDLGRAALLWSKHCHWEQAADCYFKLGDLTKSADIWLALDREDKALPLLRDAHGKDPLNEHIRLRLVETLFDTGRREEAQPLIDAALGAGTGEGKASVSFIESVGRSLEAVHDLDMARKYYELALQQDGATPELKNRIIFLDHIKRLTEDPAPRRSASSPAQELLDKYIRDSNPASPEDDLDFPEGGNPPGKTLTGHEIVVGHLALGFQQWEPPRSTRSMYSLSRRFSFDKLLAESPRGAVFLATDQLLDFIVALRLYRLPDDFNNLDVLKQRLRLIAQLNHPNLAKITFVDRNGPVIRVATEYLAGGNLRDFLKKMGGIGMPLIIRLLMHLASALHTSHLRGIPHGDVRPENIIIGPDQRIKLLDFSISPIPVKTFDLANLNVSENQETPRPFDFTAHNDGVQSDLLQFADIIEFMLEHSRRTVDPVAAAGVTDTSEEMRELVTRIRGGGFTSILRLWQVLEQIFDRTMPSHPSGERPRIQI